MLIGVRKQRAHMTKVLIIEDDQPLCSTVENWLTFNNYTVEVAYDGSNGQALLDEYQYDLVVLDWKLPDIQGIDILKRFRARGGRTPVLMLTGKVEIIDRETGLDLGADDYLTKPFDVKELGARIRALLRRPQTYVTNILQVAHLTLDSTTRQVTVCGEAVKLAPREFSLLQFLMRHPETMFPGEALLERVWESETSASLETLRTSLRRLRKRIDIEGQPSIIENVFGVGYIMHAQPPGAKKES
ncbi:MAG: response regulator transcription factor [Terriglobales bacterium]